MSRTQSMKGMIFANSANTVIPPTPQVGGSYRDPDYGVSGAANGWPYYNIVNSAQFNQIMFQMTGLLDQIEKQGILKWSNLTDFPVGGICRDDLDDLFYEALVVSGPNHGGAKQPSANLGTYWKKALAGITLRGEWNISTSYQAASGVTHNGNFYISERANTGVEPGTSADDWSLYVSKGEKGDPGSAGVEPPGCVMPFAGSGTVPDGYLLCDGSAVSRTAYTALYAAIGITYGAGDGSATFNLPDFRGNFLCGYLSGTSAAIGTRQAALVGSHEHTVSVWMTAPGGVGLDAGSLVGGQNITRTTSIKGGTFVSANGAASDEPRPVNYAVQFCIKY